MAGFFNDTTKIKNLAESIVPASASDASAAQKAARSAAVDNVVGLLTAQMQYIKDELNGVLSAGVPVPQDGGATLQSAWKAATQG